MLFSLEKVSELTGKSVKTIYRHMAQGGLRYSVDDNGERKISLGELQSFYKISVSQDLDDSQMRFPNENEIENKLDVLIELQKLQLKATIDNNALLEKMNSQMGKLEAPAITPKADLHQQQAPAENVSKKQTAPAEKTKIKPTNKKAPAPDNYIDNIPVFGKH